MLAQLISDVGIFSQLSLVYTYHRDDDSEHIMTVASFLSSLIKVIFLAYHHIRSCCTLSWPWRNFFCSPFYNLCGLKAYEHSRIVSRWQTLQQNICVESYHTYWTKMYNVTLPKPEHNSAYTCSKNDHYIMLEHVWQSEN